MADSHDHDIKKHLRVYIGVFVALLVGTIITVAVSYFHFGDLGNIVVALIIAVIKAVLVAAFFMHLSSEKKSIYRILLVTGFFLVGLMGLTLYAMSDLPALTKNKQLTGPPPAAHGADHHE